MLRLFLILITTQVRKFYRNLGVNTLSMARETFLGMPTLPLTPFYDLKSSYLRGSVNYVGS